MLDKLISLSSHSSIRVETDPERLRPIDADLQVPDTRKFQAHTGWQPVIPFETTMQDLLDYWRDRVRAEGNFLTR
jgi:GDPmannose 4,6-dehydratase